MIKSAVTVSLVPEARGGPFVFWDDLPNACRVAREVGFDAIEVFPPGPDAAPVADLRALLAQHELELAAVGTGAGWVKHKLTLTNADEGVRKQAREFIKRIIDFAGQFRAPAIIGSMQGRSEPGVEPAVALKLLAEALEELGEHARQYHTVLLYEPLNRYETNLINRVKDGVKLLSGLSTKNVRLLADLFHMNIEETKIPEALVAGGSHIGHLHFVDSNRRAAGYGHLEYFDIADALKQIKYEGYASAEALPLPDSERAARQTIAAYRKYLNSSIYDTAVSYPPPRK